MNPMNLWSPVKRVSLTSKLTSEIRKRLKLELDKQKSGSIGSHGFILGQKYYGRFTGKSFSLVHRFRSVQEEVIRGELQENNCSSTLICF